MYHVSAQGVDERMINVHFVIIIIIIIVIFERRCKWAIISYIKVKKNMKQEWLSVLKINKILLNLLCIKV